MTVDDVREFVEEIRLSADDDEVAHSMEDELYVAVLQAIVNGADNPGKLAAEALRTKNIEFSRWCA
ncbi:hypothetical protein ABD67_10070 [Bacillus sonorensis]|uniref:hypothetical protein n=1 Tax=Bacillus sonorensis TaxID=119858 RepID=UPI0018CE0C55|nr:hypothetical protein [Bacillus sonorensis]MBG9915251.1 hypothetical protein [Bacillus sonorensis]